MKTFFDCRCTSKPLTAKDRGREISTTVKEGFLLDYWPLCVCPFSVTQPCTNKYYITLYKWVLSILPIRFRVNCDERKHATLPTTGRNLSFITSGSMLQFYILLFRYTVIRHPNMCINLYAGVSLYYQTQPAVLHHLWMVISMLQLT